MVTEVKMEVTPYLSKRVQEIVINNDGGWNCSRKIQHTQKRYLYIDKYKFLKCGEDKTIFKTDKFEEIAAYDFIASNGEQEWLPKYKEEALFSETGIDWKKAKFIRYIIGCKNPFITYNTCNYKYCKPLQQIVAFTQFLKDNNAYKAYMENLKIENQRWASINTYINLEELKNKHNSEWLDSAFNFSKQPQEIGYWVELSTEWISICENNVTIWE